MQAEMSILKSVVSAQASRCNDLKQMHAVRLTDRELSLSSEHRDPPMSELFEKLPATAVRLVHIADDNPAGRPEDR